MLFTDESQSPDENSEVEETCSAENYSQAGWKQQFSCSGARLQEALETYKLLGLEVKTTPMKELDCDGCTLCFDNEADQTMMIFTRAKTD